jgi:hypothetical protein
VDMEAGRSSPDAMDEDDLDDRQPSPPPAPQRSRRQTHQPPPQSEPSIHPLVDFVLKLI